MFKHDHHSPLIDIFVIPIEGNNKKRKQRIKQDLYFVHGFFIKDGYHY